MSHLGSQLSALADGQLSPELAERALIHVAGCAECAEDLAAARVARQALAAAFDVPMAPDLTARLLALGDAGRSAGAGSSTGSDGGPRAAGRGRPVARHAAGRGGARRVDFAAGSVPLPGTGGAGVPAGSLSGEVTGRRRAPRRWMVAGAAGVAAVAVGLATVGELPEVTPSPSPARALTLLGSAAAPVIHEPHPPEAVRGRPGASSGWSTAVVQRADLGWEAGTSATTATTVLPGGLGSHDDEALPHGWSVPRALSDVYQVTAVRLDPGGTPGVEVDLAGERGLVVLTLVHGRLSREAVEHSAEVRTGGGTVHVLSTAPWHGVWQSGETVVDVVAEEPSDGLGEIVSAYTPEQVDDGAGARLARGWRALAGAWSP